jgi:hypothetical protein
MLNLEPQVQIKLLEISKEWAEKVDAISNWRIGRKEYLENFDNIYKQLVKTIREE